jgi:phage terminase small subunit
MINRKPTIRQSKALNNLVADGGSVASAMKKAGYSEKTARTPAKLLKSSTMRPEIDKVLLAIAQERKAVIERLKDMRAKANYRDLIYSLDVLTKNHQLLSGEDTERIGGWKQVHDELKARFKDTK